MSTLQLRRLVYGARPFNYYDSRTKLPLERAFASIILSSPSRHNTAAGAHASNISSQSTEAL